MKKTQSVSVKKAWLESLRLRTLPLAFASVVYGSVLAFWQGMFDPAIAFLALLTAGLLQVLSNLANDYGDAIKGSDKEDRIGPLRGMQKGVISKSQMKIALIITVVLICLSGIVLVTIACHTLTDYLGFLALGLLAIIAAITYTVGTRPYGYMGLGDISVLIFFGWLSVAGTWYLQAHSLSLLVFFPATASGLLGTAVLNINNLRDINSDRENGKNTLAVRLGPVLARRYHACLLIGALVCLAVFNLVWLQSPWGWLFILAAPLLIKQMCYVLREMEPVAMLPMLAQTVKAALLTNLLFTIGVILDTVFVS